MYRASRNVAMYSWTRAVYWEICQTAGHVPCIEKCGRHVQLDMCRLSRNMTGMYSWTSAVYREIWPACTAGQVPFIEKYDRHVQLDMCRVSRNITGMYSWTWAVYREIWTYERSWKTIQSNSNYARKVYLSDKWPPCEGNNAYSCTQ